MIGEIFAANVPSIKFIVINAKGRLMIISEKQILQLIQLAQYYSREVKLTESKLSEPIDELIKTIFNQQSEELKVVK